MKDLIEALQIFAKYRPNVDYPTHCEHDVMLMAGLDLHQDAVSPEDLARLEELGFEWHEEYDCFGSYAYGSC